MYKGRQQVEKKSWVKTTEFGVMLGFRQRSLMSCF